MMKKPWTPELDEAEVRQRTQARLAKAPVVDTAEASAQSLRLQLIELEIRHEALLRSAQKEIELARRRHAEFYDQAPVAYLSLAANGKILDANQQAGSLLAVQKDVLIGQAFSRFLAGDEHRSEFRAFLSKIFLVRLRDACELVLQPGDAGQTRTMRLEGMADEGNGHCQAVLTDVTDRHLAEESTDLAMLVYQNSSEGMMVTDAQNIILTINPAFSQITGYARSEVVGRDAKLLQSNRQDPAVYHAMREALSATGHWQGELWSRRKDGEFYAERRTINTIFNRDGTVHRRVTLLADITKKKQSDELTWMQANFDALTGLPNRGMFRDRLEQEIKKARRDGQALALMFVDLDRFKEINDTLGHSMGDMLLRDTAQRLKACVRESDTVARLGGDEFTVILSLQEGAEGVEGVDRVARNILDKLAAPFKLWAETAYVSASVGITFYPKDAATAEELLKNADQAMYAAKYHGRSRFCHFTPSMQTAAKTRMRLAVDLRSALAENQFQVYYQPIVDLQTGEVRKAEALLRWKHPVQGLISPALFIPVAEETGLINEIGEWVFQEAARQVAVWRQSCHAEFQISVNKSPVQFRSDKTVLTGWRDYLHGMGLPGQSIAVEITEGLLMDAHSLVVEKLLEFRDAGIRVALDDFGTGYSALSYLKKFDIDFLKIDQSFTRNLALGSEDMVLCEAIIMMAHKLGIKVIAEGVETEQQRDLLCQAGCDYGQGYLLARPMPAEELERCGGLKTMIAGQIQPLLLPVGAVQHT